MRPKKSTREFLYDLECSQSTITRHLHEIGKVKRRSNEIPHFLTYDQMKRRKDICLKFIEKPHDYGFLRQIVTTDESGFILGILTNLISRLTEVLEWNLTLNNVNSKKGYAVDFLKLWMCHTLWSELPHCQTINSEYYCDLLERMYAVLRERYPAIVNWNDLFCNKINLVYIHKN